MNGFHEWDDYPEIQSAKNKIQKEIEYHEDRIRVGVLAAIIIVVSTCVFLLAYC
jgi:hypothetical protein